MIKVMHVITGLSTGGAEMMLARLLSSVDRNSVTPSVVSLTNMGEVGASIEAGGVPVQALGISRRMPSLNAVYRLRSTMREFDPDVVQCWMYHADLLGGIAARSLRVPAIWSLRQSNLSREANSMPTLLTMQLCARLSSRVPARIVCGSEAARRAHLGIGYSGERMVVIPNGFDLSRFRPSDDDRVSVREELGLAPETPIVGLVARFDPQKDHRSFVEAARRIHRVRADVHFLLCGSLVTRDNAVLARWVDEAGIAPVVHLLGRREDLPRLTAALDVAVSSSIGEGFSNTIGEAMASGVPCVVTDVGDSAAIVGGSGAVVGPRDPEALADASLRLLDMAPGERARLGLAGRTSIEEHFSLGAIARTYEALWSEVATCAG
ncbi:MAG: glycosyltransferase [Thermoanaerobaculia bacterium]|nr:glycosyltransferase [Thermoanaerobaculia bacterium]